MTKGGKHMETSTKVGLGVAGGIGAIALLIDAAIKSSKENKKLVKKLAATFETRREGEWEASVRAYFSLGREFSGVLKEVSREICGIKRTNIEINLGKGYIGVVEIPQCSYSAGEIGVIAEGLDAGVMARGDIGTTEFICHAEHLAPFDMGVAEDTRVGRAAMHILVDEIADDVFTERVAEVHDMVLKAHALSVVLRLHDAIDRATAFLASETRIFDAVIRAEGDAHDFVALLEEEHCANGGVDTAGHP